MTEQTPVSASMTINDVAAFLKVSASSIRRMVAAGKMPAPVQLGCLVRWRRQTVENWFAAGCPRVAPPSEGGEA